jgi:hypothetical protein
MPKRGIYRVFGSPPGSGHYLPEPLPPLLVSDRGQGANIYSDLNFILYIGNLLKRKMIIYSLPGGQGA